LAPQPHCESITHEPSPCSINDKWDCGEVNHSHTLYWASTVADIGIAGIFFSASCPKEAWRITFLPRQRLGSHFISPTSKPRPADLVHLLRDLAFHDFFDYGLTFIMALKSQSFTAASSQ